MKRTLVAAMAFAMGAAAHAAETPLEINACALLTQAEISAAVGLPVDDGRRQDEGMSRDGQYSSTCM